MYTRAQAQPREGLRRAAHAGWAFRVLLALLLLPALLLGGAARAQSLLRCDVMQTLQSHCCCPTAVRSPVDALSRASCCTRVEVDSGLPSASLRAETEVAPPCVAAVQPALPALASLSTRDVVVDDLPEQLAPAPRAQTGPSLIVLLRRLLI